MCLGAIYWAWPKAVYFAANKHDAADVGFDDRFIYEELEKMIPDRKLPFWEMLNDEGKTAFKLWNEHESKTPY